MWTAKETSLSKMEHANRRYNYFPEVHYYGYIGCTETLQELVDYIRNSDDSYEKVHLSETTEDGAKYLLTIRSICFGYTVELLLFDLDDIRECDGVGKEELKEVKEHLLDKERDKAVNYNFNWKYFTQTDYEASTESAKSNPKEQIDEYLGHIQVGELRFDISFKDYSDHEDGSRMAFSFDCYVAYEDTGYGCMHDEDGYGGIPYDYADGTDLYNLKLSYEDFIKCVEKLLTEFIEKSRTDKSYSLVEKALAPHLEW